MNGPGISVMPKSQGYCCINRPTGNLYEIVPVVVIHQCDSNHRSQNHEEKTQTKDRYKNVRHFRAFRDTVDKPD
jgi:hypothetical protein